jgi:ABC-2 type transport system permease protein
MIVPFSDVPATFGLLVKDLGILAVGLAVYGALFALIGAVLKRPLVIGLIFAFGWEQMALLMPGYLKRFTVAHYIQALVPHAMPADGPASLLQAVFRDVPSAGTALFWLFLACTVSLFLATRAIERREYVLEQ